MFFESNPDRDKWLFLNTEKNFPFKPGGNPIKTFSLRKV